MAMSPIATRALEQVEFALLILYDGGYFTEDAWIQIDGLIHRGQYKFTKGPANHILDEPMMMFFENSKQEAKDEADLQDSAVYRFETAQKDAIEVSEDQISSPTSSEPVESGESFSRSSAESSSDRENVAWNSAEGVAMLDALDTKTLVSITGPIGSRPQAEQAKACSSENTSQTGRLPPSSSQNQLDSKTSSTESAEGGQTLLPKNATAEGAYNYASWNDTEASSSKVPETDQVPEREVRINSWASEVSPTERATPKFGSLAQSRWNQQPPDFPIAEPTKPDRDLRGIAELRDSSRILARGPDYKALETAARAVKMAYNPSPPYVAQSSGDGFPLQPSIKPGGVFIARGSFIKKASVHVDVRLGDKIKLIKHVSGSMYFGENLRTSERGQFPEQICQELSGASKEYAAMKQRGIVDPRSVGLAKNTSVGGSSVRTDLDEVERVNAAEWCRDDTSEALRFGNSASLRSSAQRMTTLGSVDADNYGPNFGREQQEMLPSNLREEISKMLDKKLLEVLNAEGAATASQSASSKSEGRAQWNKPLKSVEPKSQTCWFWATPNKECRYTAEECRDLHRFLPSQQAGEPVNSRMKPTWGALVDSLPLSSDSSNNPEDRKQTCWYWANNANCTYTAENCKFLHEYVPGGVAPRPWKKPPHWSLKTWKRTDGQEYEETESQCENAWIGGYDEAGSGWGNGAAAGWGVDGDLETELQETPTQKYQPPHIKAMGRAHLAPESYQ